MPFIKTNITKQRGELADVRFRFFASHTVRPQFKVGIRVLRDHWSDAKEELKTSPKGVPDNQQRAANIATNKKLSELRAHLLSAWDASVKQVSGFDTEELRKWLLDQTDRFLHPQKYEPKSERLKTLWDIVDDAIQQVEAKGEVNGKALGSGTIITYKQFRNYLDGFARYKGKGNHRQDWQTSDIDSDFYNEFTEWLYALGLKRNTVGKQVKTMKSILRKCMPIRQQAACEFIATKRCPVVRDKATDINAVALNEQQLEVMAAYPFTGTKKCVRDQFLLLAWTGQRFGDLPKLNPDNIHVSKCGMRYFLIEQQKTHQMCAIPILNEVAPILAEYGNQMPKILTNQKFNAILNDICIILANTKQGKAVGFNDEVTHKHNAGKMVTTERFCDAISAHSARRTFCTVMYDRGMPIAQIMQVSGHQSQAVFFDYIRKPQQEMHERMADEFFVSFNKKTDKP